MGCCFSSQASSADSHREHQRQPATPLPQDPREQADAGDFVLLPEALLAASAATPIAAPVAISGAAGNRPAIVDTITPNEAADPGSPESSAPSLDSSASRQHVILEPTVYVPPPRPNVVAELEVVPAEPSPEAAEDRARASSSSSSSSSSGARPSHGEQ
ncbi:hypothetical protein Trco_002207 [Trichoderma cornu-damae]|uniref:Uncharacterized protein n=1 Tax=Trichoderma cornu-damae TaxID=654480 RepID=A0A9P8QM70_9HYPO|nr:hypothetical protein Trco_002207 [Trichoderma cornu-damae]